MTNNTWFTFLLKKSCFDSHFLFGVNWKTCGSECAQPGFWVTFKLDLFLNYKSPAVKDSYTQPVSTTRFHLDQSAQNLSEHFNYFQTWFLISIRTIQSRWKSVELMNVCYTLLEGIRISKIMVWLRKLTLYMQWKSFNSFILKYISIKYITWGTYLLWISYALQATIYENS